MPGPSVRRLSSPEALDRRLRAIRARKRSGLPKPCWTAYDDRAYERFLKHPDPRIQMSSEYFPNSVKLRKEAESAAKVSGED